MMAGGDNEAVVLKTDTAEKEEESKTPARVVKEPRVWVPSRLSREQLGRTWYWYRAVEIVLFVATSVVRFISKPYILRIGEYYYPKPQRGFRGWIYKSSQRRWTLKGISAQRCYRSIKTIADRRLRRCIVIAVISFSGGVGKTTLAVRIMRKLRRVWKGTSILIIDVNPSPGTLRSRIRAKRTDMQSYVNGLSRGDDAEKAISCWTIEDVWRNRAELETVTDVDYCFPYSRKLGAYVLSGQIFIDRNNPRFKGVNIHETMERLKEKFRFIILDCGTDPSNEVTQQILEIADVLEIATVTSRDRLEQVAEFMATMCQESYMHQRTRLVLVVNKVIFNPLNRITDRAVRRIQKYMADEYGLEPYDGPVVTVPWSLHLGLGLPIRAGYFTRGNASAYEITAAAAQVIWDNEDKRREQPNTADAPGSAER